MGGNRPAIVAWVLAITVLPTAEAQPPGRTLVIGLSAEAGWAHAFEQQMAARLEAAGVDAVPLSQVQLTGLRELPAGEAQQAIDTLVVNHGFDAVLVGHLSAGEVEIARSASDVRLFTPYLSRAWGGWWQGLPAGTPYFGYEADAYQVKQHWRVDARLFETSNDQLLWSMALDTSVAPTRVLPAITGAAVEQLWRQGFLPQA